MAFHVGQKVVCVDVTSPGIRGGGLARRYLSEGAIYTVSAFRMDPLENIPSVQVGGVPTEDENGTPFWFQSRRFRPVIERKTDISSLVELLNPVNHKVREGA